MENHQQERRNICYPSAPQVSEAIILWYMRRCIAIVRASQGADPAGPWSKSRSCIVHAQVGVARPGKRSWSDKVVVQLSSGESEGGSSIRGGR